MPNNCSSIITMGKKAPPPPSNRTNLASCIVATIFLIFITIIILIIFFTLLKPKPPTISVTAVQLPSFSAANATVTFTISHYVAVANPNHGVFSHYDSSIRLLYAGDQMGFMFVPAGEIGARRKIYMAATFSVESFPVAPVVDPVEASGFRVGSGQSSEVDPVGVNGFRVGSGQSLEVELKMEMSGRVRVMHFFTHHVEAQAECKVVISDGSVLGFRCY